MGSIETRSTDELVKLRDKYEDDGNWLLAERCEAELERRDGEDLFHEDSPSLQDMGLELGSYGT
jgi:hypothetical protein